MSDPVVVTKKPWLSKTLWVNLLLAVAALLPNDNLQTFLITNQTYVLVGFSVINAILRVITKDAVSLTD